MRRALKSVGRGWDWARAASVAGLSTVVVTATACGPIEEFREEFRDLTPHEAYFESLKAAGLAETALAAAWWGAGEEALVASPEIQLPFQEEGFLFAETPEARSYRVRLRPGQLLTIEVSLEGELDTRVFVDLYRMPSAEGRSYIQILSADSVLTDLEYIARQEADYVIRVQPELLRGGRYRVTLRAEASLVFPVDGMSTGAIQSVFGDPRDGGRRSHRGVDIFAPRGTLVVSATDGIVSRVRDTPVGGKVVWVRDSRVRQSIYYAHLDSQLVVQGARIGKGDPVGLVGNTGNARTTPPHLHFSVYSRGPQDPYYYLFQPNRELAELTASTEMLGSWTRTTDDGIRLRSGPSRRASAIEALPRHTAFRVLAAAGSWYRVSLPDGRGGFVAARLTEDALVPVRMEVVASAAPIQSEPSPGSPVVDAVEAGTDVSVLGRFGDFLYVRVGEGPVGWMPATSAAALDR
jgi:peptidoglycan LD-endopeptidase LytH